jgi:hypothetical protein
MAPHTYGEQGVTFPAWHTPNPLQEYPVCEPLAQVVLPHLVPLAYSLQAADTPLHTPLLPQELAPSSAHSFCGSRSPTIRPQTPLAPAPFSAAVHASQVPAQAVSQQTASTQAPLVHWETPVHADPFARSGLQVPVGISQ